MRRILIAGTLLAAAGAQTGCAMIFSGTSADVRIDSDPSGANVVVLGGSAGSIVLKATKVAALADTLLAQLKGHVGDESMGELRKHSLEEIVGIIAVSLTSPMSLTFLSEKTRQDLMKIPKPIRDIVYKMLGVEAVGKTPLSLDLKKSGGYAIIVAPEGKAPKVVGLETSINWTTLLNVLNAFLGVPIDLLTGAIWNLEPERVFVRFGK
jgi:hypothetical protein